MKRIALISMAVLFAFSSVCYGAANNWGNTDTNPLLQKVLPNYLVAAGTDMSATSGTVASGTIVIPVTGYTLVTKTIGEGAGTVCTLANGVKGQILVIRAGTVTSSCTAVITPATCSGFTTATLIQAGQTITLLYVSDTIGWVLIGSGGGVSGVPILA
jgi:hypothetical protein